MFACSTIVPPKREEPRRSHVLATNKATFYLTFSGIRFKKIMDMQVFKV